MLRRGVWVAAAVALITGPLTWLAPSPASAVVCSKWASTTGSDANPGSEAAPYRSLNALIASLAPGQTGCLPANQTYYALEGNGIVGASNGTAGNPVTITSGPGGRASIKGQLWLQTSTHDITFTDLDFAGAYNQDGSPYALKSVFLLLFGDRITLRDNDITNPPGICIQLGNSNVADAAESPVVTDNRIHHCGTSDAIAWTAGDSGAHGLYSQNTTDALISENTFWANRWRGLQFWPRNNGATVRHNLFVGNATQINLGYDPEFTTNTLVEDNIFTQRVTGFWPDDNPAQLFGHLPDQALGNLVQDNCYDAADTFILGDGITLGAGNVGALPTFVNAGAGDFRLTEGSACLGKGPASIQPGGGPPPEPDPDARVRVALGPWLGATVRNTTGADQTAQATVPAGATGTFEVSLDNNSTLLDDWAVAAVPYSTGHAGFAHTWSLEGSDVTGLVDDGSLLLDDVAPSTRRTLTFSVTPSAATVGTTVTYYLHLIHLPLDDALRDVVGLQVTVAPALTTDPPTPTVLKPSVAPELVGTPSLGTRVRVKKGAWPVGTTFQYQWFAGGDAIKGATGRKLRLTRKLVGKVVRVRVTASAPGYSPTSFKLRLKGKVRAR